MVLKRFGRTQVVGLIVGLTLGVGVVTLQSAGATNFFGATGQAGNCFSQHTNMADSANHGFYHKSLTTATRNAVEWARLNVYEPTRLTTFTVSAEAFDTDVVSQDENYSTACGLPWHPTGGGLMTAGVIGATNCESLSPTAGKTNRCEKYVVRYDTSWVNIATTTQRAHLTCHETGHTTGLAHYNPDCMTSEFGIYSVHLSPHSIGHLDAL